MATFVLRDATVVVNAIDLSDHVQSVTVETSMETQDSTAMGNQARSFNGGLFADAISVTFHQDFAASEVDVTLYTLYRARTSHTVVVKATSDAVGTTNPTYTLTGLIEDITPIAGSVGDEAMCDVSWVNTAAVGMVRATA